MSNNRKVMCGDDHLQYAKSPNWLMRRTELNSNDKIVYIRLRQCGISSGQYWASQDYLAHECGFSVDTVQRSLRKLEKVGLISREQHGKKMFNSYFFYEHEWMTDDNKYEKSDTATARITQSDTATARIVTPQRRGSIYIDKREYKSINIVEKMFLEIWELYPTKESNSSKKKSRQKFEQIKNLESEFPKIVEGIKKYISFIEKKRKTGFNQNYQQLTRWLNDEGWLISWEVENINKKEEKYFSAWD